MLDEFDHTERGTDEEQSYDFQIRDRSGRGRRLLLVGPSVHEGGFTNVGPSSHCLRRKGPDGEVRKVRTFEVRRRVESRRDKF